MRKLVALIALLIHASSDLLAQAKLQLAPPVVKVQSILIDDSSKLLVQFNQPGAAVHYTWENRDPNEKDPVYSAALSIQHEGMLRLKSIGKSFLPSETLYFPFRKKGLPISAVTTSPPNSYYAKLPSNILFDNIMGNPQFRSGSWLGFDSDTVSIEVTLFNETDAREITIGLLRDEDSWIFMPNKISLFAFADASDTWQLIDQRSYAADSASAKAVLMESFPIPENTNARKLKFVMENRNPIPDWHPGKGNKGWIFVDELLID